MVLLFIGVTIAWGSSGEGAEVQPVFSRNLSDLPTNQEVQMLTVSYAPGEESGIHSHSGHTFVYVLEGTVEMAVNGQNPETLVAAQTFYEAPADVHTVSRNVSGTEKAKILVFFLKPQGVPGTLQSPGALKIE
jgi:quercetin dioxygenase-like cupin family protein